MTLRDFIIQETKDFLAFVVLFSAAHLVYDVAVKPLCLFLYGAAVALLALTIGCSKIPIGASGKGFWDQCVYVRLYGAHNVSEAGVSNLGMTELKRNYSKECRSVPDSQHSDP